jgi:hypothetical protein
MKRGIDVIRALLGEGDEETQVDRHHTMVALAGLRCATEQRPDWVSWCATMDHRREEWIMWRVRDAPSAEREQRQLMLALLRWERFPFAVRPYWDQPNL